MRRYGNRIPRSMPSPDLPVINLNECHTKFAKVPDGGLALRGTSSAYPSIVIEVGSTNDDMDMLLREAEIFLNQITTIEYVMLLNIEFRDGRVDNLRFVLCRRLPTPILISAQRVFALELENRAQQQGQQTENLGLVCKSNFGGKRKSESELRKMNAQEIDRTYQIQVINDFTVTRGTIRNLNFTFEDEPLVRGTALENQFNGTFTIVILIEDLEDIFSAPLTF